ncbi:MAG: alpha/beta fold hydrolase [Heteroscytonema crispum UTEX LB 1556]
MTIFCLVHAAYQGASSWNLVIPHLEAQGHKAVAMDLPIEDPSATLSQFAEVVIQSLPETDNDVIVVGTSMAGTIIPIVASQRPVRKLVFLAALIPYPGTSTLDQLYKDIDAETRKTLSHEPPPASKLELFHDEPEMFNPDLLGKDPLQDEAVARDFLFHDCQPEVVHWATSKLRNHKSPAHIFDIFPLEALPDVEYTYIVCADDRTISPAWSRYAARKRLGVEAIELPGGHCPYLSRPAHLADVLLKEL